ncbi:hypothetical protein [Streptomyces chrestomyceticus]|uniref:hypothetical protein n=1 Tax=Streptomyces chrestomyceticus TaxID=68185 RepID=UPI0033EA89D7
MRAWGEYLRALAALRLGRAAQAAAHARTALDGKRRLHDSVGIAMILDVLACAAVLVTARTACENQARRHLGSDAYQTAFDAGYDTDLNTGITQALTPPDTSPHAPHTPADRPPPPAHGPDRRNRRDDVRDDRRGTATLTWAPRHRVGVRQCQGQAGADRRAAGARTGMTHSR